MKKKILLSALAVSLVSSLNAADDLASMFSEGKASGQIRMFYVDRDISKGATDTHRNSTAIGGHLKYETADYKGLSLAAAFYTTNDIPWLDYTDNDGLDGKKDPSLLGTGFDSYSIIGEAYVNYDMSSLGTKTTAKLGLQRYDTPMIGSDDARMLPNTFEAYKFVNKDIDNLTLQVAQVMSVAYGTFSNIYVEKADGTVRPGGILGATAGYSSIGSATGEYNNVGKAAVGKRTNGITNIQAKYKAKNFNVTFSDDYAWDLYNTLYLDAGFAMNGFFANAQMIKQDSVGDEYMKYSGIAGTSGEIDSLYWAAKAGIKMAGVTAYAAYSQTGANSDEDKSNGNTFANAIVSQFGGMPAYTQGMVTRHQFLAGTDTYKLAASYSFKEMGTNLSMSAYYVSFDMDANSGYGGARTATEPGFDIKYYPSLVKNLQLRFRGNFPRDFADNGTATAGWNEYRFIANYNF